MIKSTQKIIKIGSSDGVTLPAKELEREGLTRGDEVEIIVRRAQKHGTDSDQAVIDTAKRILQEYQQDFQNLAKR